MRVDRTDEPLPPNVIRPSAAAWQEDWGGRALPAGYGGRWLELGDPVGLTAIGANLSVLPPGLRACPLHYHHAEEELFFVLEGAVTARELGPAADRYTEYPLRAGELVVYPAGTGLAHQSVNRGSVDALYLSLSDRSTHEVCVYPDSGKTLVRGLRTVGVFGVDGAVEDHLAASRAAAAARGVDVLLPDRRPAWVAAPEAVPERAIGEGVFGRALARAAGARRVSVNRDRLLPGAVSGPLHWHTADDELMVVLSGAPTLRQVRDGVEERVVLQPGDFVGWPAGSKLAHQVRNEAQDEAVLLVAGTDRSDDVVVLPELDRVRVRALGRTGRLVATDYWAGETLE